MSGGFTAMQIHIAHDMAIRIIPDAKRRNHANIYFTESVKYLEFRRIHQYKETDTSGVRKAA